MSRWFVLVGLLAGFVFCTSDLAAQVQPRVEAPNLVENPIGAVEQAARELGVDGGLSTSLNIVVLLTVLAIVPSVFILCTCFRQLIQFQESG